MGLLSQFEDRALWDLLSDVSFWIKDLEGRFVWVNLALAEQAQAPREQILGTLDSDWFFNELASVYMQDDARLVQQGEPILNKPELVVNATGVVEWQMTSKYALRGPDGRIVGSYGMSQPMQQGSSPPAEYADLADVVRCARRELSNGISVEALARHAHISVSTLERNVRRHLRMSPQQLLQRIRMQRARQLLIVSTLKVGEIALDCGYESFSSFSRAFKKTYACAPGDLRRGHSNPRGARH